MNNATHFEKNIKIIFDYLEKVLYDNNIKFSRVSNMIFMKSENGVKTTIADNGSATFDVSSYFDIDNPDNTSHDDIVELIVEVIERIKRIELIENDGVFLPDNYQFRDYIKITPYDPMLNEDHCLKVFDGTSYKYADIVLQDFWDTIDKFKSKIYKMSEGKVDVYTYKGKEWYITPSVIDIDYRIYIHYFDSFILGEDYSDEISCVAYHIDEETEPIARNIVNYLEETKQDLLERSKELLECDE